MNGIFGSKKFERKKFEGKNWEEKDGEIWKEKQQGRKN